MWWWQSQALGGAFNAGVPVPAELGTSCAYAVSAAVRLAAASAARLPSLRNVRRLILDACITSPRSSATAVERGRRDRAHVRPHRAGLPVRLELREQEDRFHHDVRRRTKPRSEDQLHRK